MNLHVTLCPLSPTRRLMNGRNPTGQQYMATTNQQIGYAYMDNFLACACTNLWAPNLSHSALRNMQNEKLQQQLMDKLLNIKFGAL